MIRTVIVLCRLTVLALLLGAAAEAQSISITSVPFFGSSGNLTGVVSGANPGTHVVAVYIHIEGVGWWTKPSSGMAAVPIQPNGTFSANVVTGGSDSSATVFHVGLVPQGTSIPVLQGGGTPSSLNAIATDTVERYAREVQFAGRTWGVKYSGGQVGPGGNFFSSSTNDVWVDTTGRLHLRVRFSAGAWRSSEVILKESLGYGTYWFTTESEVEDLDRNVTFGAFTWDVFGDDTTIPSWPNREIDFEDSRWGNAGDPTTSQVVIQPYWVSGNIIRYTTPDLSADPELTRSFDWSPSKVDFMVARGRHTPCTVPPSSVVHQNTFTHNPASGNRVPPAGRERMRFNLWINGGSAPSNGQTQEVIISDFRFSGTPGVFSGGSGINQADSLRVLSGTPTIGTTINFALVDPAGVVTTNSLSLLLFSAFSSPDFPASGKVYSGLGYGGGDIELLVAEAPDPLILYGPLWFGSPLIFPIALPNVPALVGLEMYVQGALYDFTPAIELTNGLEMCFLP